VERILKKEAPMKVLRAIIIGFVFLSLVACCAYCQNASLTKDSIIQMSKAGLPEDVIISKIKAEPNPLNFSTDDLIALKAAGVSDGVLRALVAPAAKPEAQPPASPPPAAAADPDNPLSPHDPGIYLMTATRDSGKKMVMIERAGSARDKTAHV